MKDTIFREYDIRGKVGQDLLLEELYNLGCALAVYFKSQDRLVRTIVLGMDGRSHSAQIKSEISRALTDSGFDVIFIGMCPSPVLYFALHSLPVDAGLMITASHNPKEYNGIKISCGINAVWGVEIQKIKQLYKERKKIIAQKKGSEKVHLLIPDYIEYLVNQFSHLKDSTLSIVFDCANAVSGLVIPDLVTKMGWKNARVLYADIDGDFPNHEADPVVVENMRHVKHLLAITDAQIGIGFDGDADRMCAMTKDGVLLSGDRLLAIFAQEMIKHNANLSVVFNVTTSSGLIELLEQWGADAYMVQTGHAIVKEKMHQTGAQLGGEVSCHFFFQDRYFGYDDGIYAALRLIEIVEITGKTLTELVSIFPKKELSREYRIACAEELKKNVVDAVRAHFLSRTDVSLVTIDGVRVTYKNGWGIVRAANTQPALSARFESDTKEGIAYIKKDFISVLEKYLSPEVLKILDSE